MLSFFDLLAILLTLSALFGWLNRKFLPLPHTIGLLTISGTTSLVLVAIDTVYPSHHLFEPLTTALLQIDFSAFVMNGILAFLLFASALHVDLGMLRTRAAQVALLATVSTLVSTGLVAIGLWCLSALFSYQMTWPWALVFGALISPTDPVAVIGVLKNINVPEDLLAEMQGESLFNDGVGIVLFTLMLQFAMQGGSDETSTSAIIELVILEAGGGLLLGIVTGYLSFLAMQSVDDYAVEVLITLALVTGTYALAQKLHVSGPLSVVAAGLLIGDRGPRDAMSETTQRYVFALWTLIDEILNSVLFLLIGLEVLILRFSPSSLLIGLLAIPVVLASRLVAVSVPPFAFSWMGQMSMKNVPFLTWAAIRGGISIALALSLPDSDFKPVILAATYAVVLFSVIVQGTTLGWVTRRTVVHRAGRRIIPEPYRGGGAGVGLGFGLGL